MITKGKEIAMDLLPCGFGLWNTEGQDILGSTHPIVILLSAPQARVVNIIPPVLLYKKKPFLAFTVTTSHEKLAQGSSFFLFSASTEIWAAATERVTEDAGTVLSCLDLESLQADVHKCIYEALALKQGYEESRWPWRDTKWLEELRNRNKEIAGREMMLRARTRPVPLPLG